LDGLRALSISLVLIGHATSALAFTSLPARLGISVLGNGGLGVQVFFVISGFLITHLLLAEHRRNGSSNLRQFYIRRVFRICPAFYTLILVVAALSVVGILDASRKDVLHAATFTWLYNYGEHNWFLGHSWSLSVEEQFYLLWPAALVLLGSKRARWLALGIILAVPLARAGMVLTTSKALRRVCYIPSAGRFDVLMFGCVAALIWQSRRLQSALHGRVVPSLCLLLSISAIATSAMKQLAPALAGRLLFVTFADTIIGLGIFAGILFVVSRPRSAIGWVLNRPLLAWLGTLSYSLYLWQQLFLVPDPKSPIQKMPLNLLLALLAGAASFYLIERPATRLRVRLFKDPVPAGPAL
jgi:peptidoglycan/LPS O-acetylase OafA/YrhL